jgi:hypothetical protein
MKGKEMEQKIGEKKTFQRAPEAKQDGRVYLWREILYSLCIETAELVFVTGSLTHVTTHTAVLPARTDEEEDPPFQEPKTKGWGTPTNKDKVKIVSPNLGCPHPPAE